LHSSGREHYH